MKSKPTFRDYLSFFLIFIKIGWITIGGGLAMVPLLQRELVEKRKFLEKVEFVDAVALGQSVPGVIATNMGVYVGRRVYGTIGSIIASLGLVIPSYISIILVITVLSLVKDSPVTQKVLSGILASSAAMILLSAVSLGKSVIKDFYGIIIAIIAFALIVFFKVSAIWVLIGAGVLGVARYYILFRKADKNAD